MSSCPFNVRWSLCLCVVAMVAACGGESESSDPTGGGGGGGSGGTGQDAGDASSGDSGGQDALADASPGVDGPAPEAAPEAAATEVCGLVCSGKVACSGFVAFEGRDTLARRPFHLAQHGIALGGGAPPIAFQEMAGPAENRFKAAFGDPGSGRHHQAEDDTGDGGMDAGFVKRQPGQIMAP